MALLLKDEDTICAIATPPGPGGIGVVRVSGPSALAIMKRVFLPYRHRKEAFNPQSHRLYYGHVIDPERGGEVLDECLAVFMKAPHTYTREDVLEIQSHSGYAVLKGILDLMVSQGARLAFPGEFTKRAFLNGRIDLSQAEAVMELIGAQTDHERRIAVKGVLGRGEGELERIRQALLGALAQVEVAIDFPEEDIEIVDPKALAQALGDNALVEIEAMIRMYDQGRIIREGARVVFAGRPNVGKSSIFNAILGMGRVIVSPVPGTTRDTVEESVDIEGMRIVLVDTAGIRHKEHDGDTREIDDIEAKGIELSITELKRANLALLVLDAGEGITDEDLRLFSLVPKETPFLVVLNKVDRLTGGEEALMDFREFICKEAPRAKGARAWVPLSARTGEGLMGLKKAIFQSIVSQEAKEAIDGQGFLPNLRQKECLERARTSLKAAIEGLREERPLEICAMDLRDALKAIDEVTGRGLEGDLLDKIFSSFCLGK